MRLSNPAALIATGFGLGLLPGAPGTWASLAALPCGWLLGAHWGIAGILGAAATAFAAGWWASGHVAASAGAADPGFIVIDEIAAQLLVLAVMPHRFWFYVAAFLGFRLFDIWKPVPIRQLERAVGGGLGIMLDDVLAALYAAALIWVCAGTAGVRP